jgi:hypothetical protein
MKEPKFLVQISDHHVMVLLQITYLLLVTDLLDNSCYKSFRFEIGCKLLAINVYSLQSKHLKGYKQSNTVYCLKYLKAIWLLLYSIDMPDCKNFVKFKARLYFTYLLI